MMVCGVAVRVQKARELSDMELSKRVQKKTLAFNAQAFFYPEPISKLHSSRRRLVGYRSRRNAMLLGWAFLARMLGRLTGCQALVGERQTDPFSATICSCSSSSRS